MSTQQLKQNAVPRWSVRWLQAAGIYNLAWGTAMIAFPNFLFDLTRIERMNYPEIWQCVGMIVGVYGMGYLIAAQNPRATGRLCSWDCSAKSSGQSVSRARYYADGFHRSSASPS